jgi:hypothetical protein
MAGLVRRSRRRATRQAERVLTEADASVLDLIDNVLNLGVVLSGDVVFGLAGVDLIYARISALLCAADRVFPGRAEARARARARRPPSGLASRRRL